MKHKSHFYLRWRQRTTKQSTHVVHTHKQFSYAPHSTCSFSTSSPPLPPSSLLLPSLILSVGRSCFRSTNTWIKYMFDLNEIYRNSILIDCLMCGYCFFYIFYSLHCALCIAGLVRHCRSHCTWIHLHRRCVRIIRKWHKPYFFVAIIGVHLKLIDNASDQFIAFSLLANFNC